MPRTDPVLRGMRAICLALPDTKLTMTWGKPHFRVGDKIFAGCGEEGGRTSIGFKLAMDHAKRILKDPRFTPAPYVGHKGWVSMDASAEPDWDEVAPLVIESYRLIAPKRSLAKLDGEPRPERAAKPAKRKASARAAKRKTSARPAKRKTARKAGRA